MEEKKNPFETELIVINLFCEMASKIASPKKLKAAARRHWEKNDNGIHRLFAERVMSSTNPHDTIERALEKITDVYHAARLYAAEGCHGLMLFKAGISSTKPMIEPVRLKTLPNWLTTPWSVVQEMEILWDVAEAWMKENNRTVFVGQIALFPECGFSGQPTEIMLRIKDGKRLVQVEGTTLLIETSRLKPEHILFLRNYRYDPKDFRRWQAMQDKKK